MTVLFTPADVNEATSQEFDDGDPPSKGCVNPLGEAAFNTAHYAALRVGLFRTLAVSQVGSDATILTQKLTTNANAWGTTPGADLVTLANFGAGGGADIYELDVDFVAAAGGEEANFRLEYSLNGGAHVAIDYAEVYLDQQTDAETMSMHVGGYLDLTGGTAADPIVFYLNAKTGTGGPVKVYSPLRSTVKRMGYNA